MTNHFLNHAHALGYFMCGKTRDIFGKACFFLAQLGTTGSSTGILRPEAVQDGTRLRSPWSPWYDIEVEMRWAGQKQHEPIPTGFYVL